jgi:hypothetical protein
MTALLGIWLLLQATGWTARPASPTVGDTVWLEREFALAPGWRLRAGKLEGSDQVEPLGDAALQRTADGWRVRYPVAVWAPGAHAITLPPIWRLAPDGRADSLSGGVATVAATSVIPDTVRSPEPRGAIAPVRWQRRRALPPAAALLVAGALLALGVRWRRRRPLRVPPAPQAPLEPEVPDARWLAAGEPKAVASRAVYQLRLALARAIPDSAPSLSTAECLAVVERARPDAPLRELRDLLDQLDRVAFASAHGTDVAALAQMARRLGHGLAR